MHQLAAMWTLTKTHTAQLVQHIPPRFVGLRLPAGLTAAIPDFSLNNNWPVIIVQYSTGRTFF